MPDLPPTHMIEIANTAERYACPEDADLLRSMERFSKKGIPVGCRHGGCGICKVQVVSGQYTTGKMNRAVLRQEEACEGWVLACKTYPRSTMRVCLGEKLSGTTGMKTSEPMNQGESRWR